MILYDPRKNIWKREKKSSKIGQDQRNSISGFAYFLSASAKVEFLEGKMSPWLCLHPNLRFFQYFLSFKSFGNSWGYSYTKLVILDISFRFTCGEFGPVLKYCKVPKYDDQDCLNENFSFTLYTSIDDSSLWKKHATKLLYVFIKDWRKALQL